MTWPFGDLMPLRYGAIIADPPWQFINWSAKGEGRSPSQHYDCMTLDEIKALPVGQLAAPHCVLFLWVVDPMIKQGLEVMEAWGFTHKTVGFYWAKTTLDGAGFPMSTGYWTRANPEQAFLGTIGKPKRRSAGVRRLIVAPRREHSRKPDEVHERVEKLVDGPYLELFARTSSRPGWDFWGAETEKFSNAL